MGYKCCQLCDIVKRNICVLMDPLGYLISVWNVLVSTGVSIIMVH